MNPPPGCRRRQHRYSARRHACLDAETHATLEDLAHTFHRKSAQIFRHVKQWRLIHANGWTLDRSIPDHPHLVHMLVEPDLLQQVQEAADARGQCRRVAAAPDASGDPRELSDKLAGGGHRYPRMSLAITIASLGFAWTR
jgi:hypothetical protein